MKYLLNIVIVIKIEDACIGFKHLPRRYERGDVEAMLKYVKVVFETVLNVV